MEDYFDRRFRDLIVRAGERTRTADPPRVCAARSSPTQ